MQLTYFYVTSKTRKNKNSTIRLFSLYEFLIFGSWCTRYRTEVKSSRAQSASILEIYARFYTFWLPPQKNRIVAKTGTPVFWPL